MKRSWGEKRGIENEREINQGYVLKGEEHEIQDTSRDMHFRGSDTLP